MNWTQSQPAALPVTYDQAAAHLQLVDDDDRDYVVDLIGAAVEHAETMMGASLITRTVTAVFNAGEPLYLPRGPVQSITSVRQSGSNVPIAGCTVEGHGAADLLVVPTVAWTAPLTVVYAAGYGDAAAAVPADVRMAIRQHVYSMYENRQPVSDKQLVDVPHALADFYRLKSRQAGIG